MNQSPKEGAAIKLYLVRHGKTELNEQGLVQGWSDSPLTPAGRAVIETLGKGLSDIPFSHAFCSDFIRTRQTAEIILAQNPKSPALIELPGLREFCFGKYESGPDEVMWNEVFRILGVNDKAELFRDRAFFTEAFETIARSDETGAAEHASAFSTRLMDALTEIVGQVQHDGGENVLIVSHGGAIPFIISNLGGHIYREMDNGCVTLICCKSGEYTIESIGDPVYMQRGQRF